MVVGMVAGVSASRTLGCLHSKVLQVSASIIIIVATLKQDATFSYQNREKMEGGLRVTEYVKFSH